MTAIPTLLELCRHNGWANERMFTAAGGLSDGQLDRRYYELCVLECLQEALQSGVIWAAGGRRYGNIEDLLIPREAWIAMSRECYADLGLPENPMVWLAYP